MDEFGQSLTIDGAIGPATVETLNNVKDQENLLNRIAEIRKKYYEDLAYDKEGNKTKNHKYLNGWFNRVDKYLNANS